MSIDIFPIWDNQLSTGQLQSLKKLFDNEYKTDYGEWNREKPYGYAPAELRIIAVERDKIVGHVSMQRRQIEVNRKKLLVAGTGGVLVAPEYRKDKLGKKLLHTLHNANETIAPVDFGYLGCREAVVNFYESCGYTRIYATQISISRETGEISKSTDSPIMICPELKEIQDFPTGTININGIIW